MTHTHMGMGTDVNSYPLVDIGNPISLFFSRGYDYGIVKPGELTIAISGANALAWEHKSGSMPR